MPFYKKQDDQLLVGNFIDGPGYTLSEIGKDEHTYPVDGWYWFDNLDAAIAGLSAISSDAVSRRQGRRALLLTPSATGNKLDDVEALLNSIQDPIQKRMAMIDYESDQWHRSNATLQAMWSMLGGTPEELDAVFELARVQ